VNYYYYSHTVFGTIGMAEENGNIIRIMFGGNSIAPAEGDTQEETPLVKETFSQLDAYFAGNLKTFSLPLEPRGTDFMKLCWSQLCLIPYGETASYKDIAKAIGNEKAVRAVGLANNRNPIPLIIPCHRVIGSNGKLVGFAGGLDMKRKLLELEQKQYALF
jgi:methylated-DNA-[protein]-cysteine S-methyltransferase